MKSLKIDVRQYGGFGEVEGNILHSTSLGIPELELNLDPHDGVFVICGSGPSISDNVEKIRSDKESGHTICAVKDAYDFLRANDLIPDLYLSVEPRHKPVRNPHKGSTFLLASRCHKQMFEDLKDYPVKLWHSWSEQEDMEILKDRPRIGGGTTSGLRAVNVAYCLGYRKFKMYGMDSSLGVRGEKRVGQDTLGDHVTKMDVIVDNVSYITNMAMAAQAQDFQSIYDVMPDISVEMIGTGLIPAIWQARKQRGLRC